MIVLLRRTIRSHLRRSRPEKILNVFQRIHLRFFLARASHPAPLIRLVTNTMSDRLLVIFKPITKNCSKLAAQAAGTSIAPYLAGCSKRSSSKAAAEEQPQAYPLGYVEDLIEGENEAGGLFQHPAKADEQST